MMDQTAPLLPVLMGELHAFCKARKGRVNTLAADLQTAQPTISNWLRGVQEPGGEATLRMQQWLERAKAAEAAELADIEASNSAMVKALAAQRNTGGVS
jgi:hypothetical protein